MTHTLQHQVLVADLVVPVCLARDDGQVSRTAAGARLADDTWLRGDLMVFREERDGDGDGPDAGRGAPLLAVEVVSAASRATDLGPKRDRYERAGVPAYWIVDLRGGEPCFQVFELDGSGRYAERALVTWGRSAKLTVPFDIELAPDQIFDRPSRRLAPGRKPAVSRPESAPDDPAARRVGPDLPDVEDPILADAFGYRWPTGAEKVELWDGCPVFYGEWDDRDVEAARRAYPGRVVRLDQDPGEPGTMTVLPGPAD
ncbi:Uma2 family endonuclease [Actinomadura logoneensis]|uniref:Uma2 family endonuclease n=1 Tax=Actinomadura logoneensis TaxID=2293572 RepID=A0A372JRT3_9ACTN|nr:Uma2 family endonuclease [Actinomadura logoneensis]RFU42496.1 Uma2 family endonuclease [Actinomadura logoneensis]